METIWAYLDGAWIPSAGLRVAVDDIGFLLGATVTERLRTFRGQLFRLDEHMVRMRRSLEIVGLDARTISAQVAGALHEFVERNRGIVVEDDDWTVVAFATPGTIGSGRPTLCVYGYPLQFHQWAGKYETGVPVIISSTRQVPGACWPPELKCRSRMHFYLADRDAAERQPGARAILLDEQGHVAEATTANVLAYFGNEGLVSPTCDNILAGVSLGVVRELADLSGVPFVMRPFSPEELRSATEAMLASTSICLLPISECDGKEIGNGQPGPIFRQLLSAWGKMVGVDVAEQARRFASRRI